MSKIRIYELAKQLGVANKDLVAKINSIGIEAKSHMAMLTCAHIRQLRHLVGGVGDAEHDATQLAALFRF